MSGRREKIAVAFLDFRDSLSFEDRMILDLAVGDAMKFAEEQIRLSLVELWEEHKGKPEVGGIKLAYEAMMSRALGRPHHSRCVEDDVLWE
jgi:hypothetical protein